MASRNGDIGALILRINGLLDAYKLSRVDFDVALLESEVSFLCEKMVDIKNDGDVDLVGELHLLLQRIEDLSESLKREQDVLAERIDKLRSASRGNRVYREAVSSVIDKDVDSSH